jgi:RNA-directed DNA polymerase
MDGHGKSDSLIVPAKLPNKAGRPAAEAVEGRGLAEGNTDDPTRPGRRAGSGAPSGSERVRQVARQDKDAQFTALLHHVTLPRLYMAYEEIQPRATAGVEGVTWAAYGQSLEDNLKDPHERVHGGSYRAKPSRRAYIPKADGRLRPLGIASLEDKIVQRAVVEVLNAIYEEDFLGFSYGFRPGRGPHHALDALAVGIYRKKVNWILDADIRDFFSKLDRAWLQKFLEHRIADKRVLRLIQKWLNAGVIEDGEWKDTLEGSPRGASVSPLLANVYLHYVLDPWVRQWRKRYARGDMIVTRFADDFIVGFEHQSDAARFLRDLRERFARFNLELHPEKTRLIQFGRYAAERRAARGLGKPETFDFLGFTHICGKGRNGRFWLRRLSGGEPAAAGSGGRRRAGHTHTGRGAPLAVRSGPVRRHRECRRLPLLRYRRPVPGRDDPAAPARRLARYRGPRVAIRAAGTPAAGGWRRIGYGTSAVFTAPSGGRSIGPRPGLSASKAPGGCKTATACGWSGLASRTTTPLRTAGPDTRRRSPSSKRTATSFSASPSLSPPPRRHSSPAGVSAAGRRLRNTRVGGVYDDGDWTLHLPDLDTMASDIAAEFRTHIPNQRPFLAALAAIGAPRGYYSVTAHLASASPEHAAVVEAAIAWMISEAKDLTIRQSNSGLPDDDERRLAELRRWFVNFAPDRTTGFLV